MTSQESADQPSPATSQVNLHESLDGRETPTDPNARYADFDSDLESDTEGSEGRQFVGSDAHEPGRPGLPYNRNGHTVEEDAGSSVAETNPGTTTDEDDSGQSTVATVGEADEQPVEAITAEYDSRGSTVVENSAPSAVQENSEASTLETNVEEASEPVIQEAAVESESRQPNVAENTGSSSIGNDSEAPGEVRNVYPPEPPSSAYTKSPESPVAARQAPLPVHVNINQPNEAIIPQRGPPERPSRSVEFVDQRQSRQRHEESVQPRTPVPRDIPPAEGRHPHSNENRNPGYGIPVGHGQYYSPGAVIPGQPVYPGQDQRPIPQPTGQVAPPQGQPANRPMNPGVAVQDPDVEELKRVKEAILRILNKWQARNGKKWNGVIPRSTSKQSRSGYLKWNACLYKGKKFMFGDQDQSFATKLLAHKDLWALVYEQEAIKLKHIKRGNELPERAWYKRKT